MDVLDPPCAPRAVVVAAHGLNQRAAALRPLYERLRARGAVVVVLCLRGHRRDDEDETESIAAWRAVTKAHWLADWQEATAEGEAQAVRHAIPLTYLGFSLGALVQVHAMAHAAAPPPYVRQVFLAPAIRVQPQVHAIRVFRPLGAGFLLPSLTPAPIRSHPATSVAAYESLFHLEGEVAVMEHPERLRIPTLVLIDPRDELVSASRISAWIERHGLGETWRVQHVAKDTTTTRSRVHHYITDGTGLGTAPFDALSARVCAALLEGELAERA